MATMAVRELGPEMRMRAAAHLVGGMEAASKVQDAEPYRLALLWVADRNILDKAAQAMPATWINSWAKLSPLYAVVDEPDEGALLIRVLGQSGELSMTARNWVVFRLGDLKDKRAIHLLTEALVRVYGNREARDALSSIGGVEVENQMLALLRDKNQGVRSMATEVLFRLQGPRGCDLARRMVREDNFGERMLAMSHLGQFGTADDLPLLLPCCDYWKADRRNIYWATSAVVQIRERCIYDINGPIVRQAGAK